jgi:hypothetical protein
VSDEGTDQPIEERHPDLDEDEGDLEDGEVVVEVTELEVEEVLEGEGGEIVVQEVEVEVEEIVLAAPGPKEAYVKLWQPTLPIPDPGSGGPVIFIGKAQIVSWQDTAPSDQADYVAGYRSNDATALNSYVAGIPAASRQWLLNLNAVPRTSTLGLGFQVIYAFVPTAPAGFVTALQGLLSSPLPLQFVTTIQDTRGDAGPATQSYQAFAALVVGAVGDLAGIKPQFVAAGAVGTQYALGGSYDPADTLKRR